MYVIVLYLLLCGIGIYDLTAKKRIGKKGQGILLAAVFVFFLLRFNMGQDQVTYVRMFNEVPNQYAEALKYYNARFPLWALMMKFCSTWNFDFAFYQFTIDAVILILLTYAICKYSKNWIFSLIIFVGSGVLNVYYTSAFRQMFAMAVFIVAFYKYLLNGNYWKYYILMFLCFFIHEDTIFPILVGFFYPIIDMIWKKKWTVIGGAVWFVAFVMINFFAARIAPFFPVRWAEYLLRLDQTPISIMGVGLQVVLILLIWGLYHFASEDVKKDRKVRYQMLVCLLSFAIYLVFIRMPLMSRVCDYLTVIHIVLIPNLIMSCTNRKMLLALVGGVMALNFVLCYVDMADGMARLYDQSLLRYPYVTVFNIDDVYKYYDFGDQLIR